MCSMSFVSAADTLQDAWPELNGEEEFVGDNLTFLDVSDRESDVRNFKKMHISRSSPELCVKVFEQAPRHVHHAA